MAMSPVRGVRIHATEARCVDCSGLRAVRPATSELRRLKLLELPVWFSQLGMGSLSERRPVGGPAFRAWQPRRDRSFSMFESALIL